MAHRRGFGWVAGLGLGALVAVPAAAQAPQAPPAPARARPTAPDPEVEAARIAFEALPEAERRGLQDALVWTGDSNGVVTGTFGRRTYEGLLAYGQRSGRGPGLPDAAGRAALLKAGAAARDAVGFRVRPDPASGAVLGLPERLLPKRFPQPGGTRWQSADGRITVETKSLPPGEGGLDALFARLTAPGSERRVTYKLRRPDFLVVAAETAGGRSYIRYAAGSEGLRGLTIGYDKALAADLDRLVIAIANSFVPFPEAVPAPAPVAAVPAHPALPAPISAAPVATGLLVGPGRMLTSLSALEGCVEPRIGGAPARILARDAARNLALLETDPTGTAPVLPPLRGSGNEAGPDRVVVAANAEGVAVAPGEASPDGGRVTAPLQPGAGGAPVLDRTGALVGLIARFPAAPRLVAGLVPPASYGLVPTDGMAGFLAEAGIAIPPAPLAVRTGAATLSAGRAASALAGGVLGLTCRP